MGFVERPRRIVSNDSPTAPLLGGRRASTAGSGLRTGRQQARHDGLLSAVTRLDVTTDPQALRELADWISEQYTTGYDLEPLGFLAPCMLGHPYVDHRLSLEHLVLDHFAGSEPVPAPFAGARTLVRSGAYAYIEVFEGGLLLPVLPDGTVVPPRP